MKQSCENIYKNARRAAGLTQEQAAEQLFISVRSLVDEDFTIQKGGKQVNQNRH